MLKHYVDQEIGDWIVTTENGDYAILMVKDIGEFCSSVRSAAKQKTIRKMREQLERSLRSIEFAPVQVKGSGKVKWNGGEFVGVSSTNPFMSRMDSNPIRSD